MLRNLRKEGDRSNVCNSGIRKAKYCKNSTCITRYRTIAIAKEKNYVSQNKINLNRKGSLQK